MQEKATLCEFYVRFYVGFMHQLYVGFMRAIKRNFFLCDLYATFMRLLSHPGCALLFLQTAMSGIRTVA